MLLIGHEFHPDYNNKPRVAERAFFATEPDIAQIPDEMVDELLAELAGYLVEVVGDETLLKAKVENGGLTLYTTHPHITEALLGLLKTAGFTILPTHETAATLSLTRN